MHDPDRFAGTFTAIVTPFTASNAIDFDALGRLLDEQIAAGIQGVVVLGTTGESPTVTDEEGEEIMRFAVERVRRRMLVIAGTGSNFTDQCLKESRTAEKVGIDGLLIVTPYYNKPTQAGLVKHYFAVADAVDLPIIVYNIAGRTSVNLETQTLLQLAEHPRIIGVKEASGDVSQIMDVIGHSPPDFLVLSGDDVLTLPIMALGGDGVISVLSNLLPAEVCSLVDSARQGDWDAARRRHYDLLPIIRGCFMETNPIPIKTALAMQGKVGEYFRLPLCPMQPENRARWETLVTRRAPL